jgi:uncharacterized protein
VDPQQLEAIGRRHGILLLLQFGSTVTGSTHPDSDLDLAILLEHPPSTLKDHAELIGDLQTLARGQDVDVAILNRADPLFLKKITEQCKLLFGSSRTFQEFKIYAFKRYQDHRRYLALERDYVAKALRRAAP